VTSDALADGSSNILNRRNLIEESRSSVHEVLRQKGLDMAAMDSLWASLPQSVFLRFSNDQLAWAATEVLSAADTSPVLVAVRELKQQGISCLLR